MKGLHKGEEGTFIAVGGQLFRDRESYHGKRNLDAVVEAHRLVWVSIAGSQLR